MDLSNYDKGDYQPGGGLPKRIFWYFVNALIFDSWLFPWSAPKCLVLRAFGASIGTGVVIKPRVNIKYPWHLKVGDNVWLGEGVWIDNLGTVKIGSNVCVSQDAYLLTGNHNYKIATFPLIVKGITIDDGAWVGARAVVCPGVRIRNNTIVTVGSVITGETEENAIYQGNPAQFKSARSPQK